MAENERENFDKSTDKNRKRKIGYIVEKVAQWRKLYQESQQSTGNHKKLSLEDAAKLVKISKKSLDEYLL